jgi:biotin carboxyl carrier protein
MSRTYEVRWNGASLRVEVRPGGAIVVDGAEATVEPAGPGAWRVTIEGAVSLVLAAGPPRAPWLFHDGVTLRPEVDDADVRPRGRSAAPGALAAPMPATVRSVLVGPGDRVAAGQTLIVLEAMKMELPLRAPADGVVAVVRCAPGELVQAGVPLVELA